tara:strand:- start:3279 stop:6278 length:3000 start_codon:yes stop_codon:yes gene_type:complete
MKFSEQDVETLEKMLNTFLSSTKWPPQYEFEAILKSKDASSYQQIDRQSFENVIRRLNALGYKKKVVEPTLDMMYLDNNRSSKLRVSIRGKKAISRYCSEGKINTLGNNVYFTIKSFLGKDNYLNISDYNLKYNLKKESEYTKSNFRDTNNIIRQWQNLKKTYRYKQRYSFYSDDNLYRIDLTIVKSSRYETKSNKEGKTYKTMVFEKHLLDSDIFKNPPSYEVEVEFIGAKHYKKDELMDTAKIIGASVKHIGILFQALSGSYYIISKSIKNDVMEKYTKLTNKQYFYAPLPVTLETQNIAKMQSYDDVYNIRQNYSVTEKADGDRNLILIFDNGENKCNVYTYNRQNELRFMGVTTDIKYNNTIIDGELIGKNINGKTIQLFMAFDIYFNAGENVKDRKLFDRIEILKTFKTDVFTILDNNPFRFNVKEFYKGNDAKIFKASNKILSKEKQKGYEYHIDGLIFTPLGPVWDGEESNSNRWDSAFKWKPPEENTIDFLIKIEKDDNDKDKIYTFSLEDNEVRLYKKVNLYVGYKPQHHDRYNACRVINENPSYNKKYSPIRFLPTYPFVKEAYITYIVLSDNVILCEDGSQIQDNTIVEFRYNGSDKKDKWIPLRVRNSSHPNAFTTAINVWSSIHNPVTKNMITTGLKIPTSSEGYYATLKRDRKELLTYRLQEFHSKYVKSKLIETYSNDKDTLLDLSVGKAGDLNKWIHNKLSFVLGQDISNHGLNNSNDGACLRVLNKMKQNKNVPLTFFIYGDSGKRISDGSSALNELNKFYLDVLYANIDKKKVLNKHLRKFHGKAKKGFNIVSSQFSIHYFFKNKKMLDGFIQNVVDNLSEGGYFIGTCLDGKRVFDLLSSIKKNKFVEKKNNKKIIWKITKKYDKSFEANTKSLGMKIDVFIDSINQTLSEYLVNFEYLEKVFAKHNIKLINSDYFSDLFNNMIQDDNTLYDDAKKMTDDEKDLSFLYRQFVFQKITPETEAPKKSVKKKSTIIKFKKKK